MFLFPPVCTYLTYLHGSHLTPNLGNFSLSLPQHPASQGAAKGVDGSFRDSGRRLSGNDLFLQLVKKYLQLFQVSFVCGQEGRAPRGARALLCGVKSAARQKALPIRIWWERRPLQRGREPSWDSDKTKRK